MKQSIFFYKELTPAEVGETGTHEIYVRLPNKFDYESFFAQPAVQNDNVLEIKFNAYDITESSEEKSVALRFVYFINSNKEKRIPSLASLFEEHNVEEGDIVCLESRNIEGTISYYISFFKRGTIQISPSSIYFSKIYTEVTPIKKDKKKDKILQQIFFGTPGSGKSYTIRDRYEQDPTKVIRTTFHPDTDYASFVGCYKPITYEVDGEKKIKYDFVPQAFTEAYVKAWNDRDNQYYLILEEINRGNCAQIFGDLFQLLDRNEEGWSEYTIKADADLRKYLEDTLVTKDGIKDGQLCLPPNLSIIASMNTSDQSLFPMDSAFKRRWAWEYVPIDYFNEKSGTFTITLGNKLYRWHDFLKKINKKIKKVTSSEDKQMGNFFIKHSVDEKEFKDKVMFYLWSEVGKDNYQTNDAIFKCYKDSSQEEVEFSFNELYPIGTKKLQDFMAILEVPTIEDADIFDDEEDEETEGSSSNRIKQYFAINGEGRIISRKLPFEVVTLYVKQNPEMSTEDVIEVWKPIRTLNNVVISEEEYNNKLSTTTDRQFTRRYDPLTLSDGGTIYIFNNTVPRTTQEFINQINSQNWNIHIEKLEE